MTAEMSFWPKARTQKREARGKGHSAAASGSSVILREAQNPYTNATLMSLDSARRAA